jgi:hypothetical protein
MANDREPRNIKTAPSAAKLAAGKRNMEKGREARARRAAESKAKREAGERSRLELYRAGELPLTEWTDEELQRCRPANLDGGYAGALPRLTSKEYAAIKREMLVRGQRMLDSYYHDAVKVLHEIATDPIAPEPARVKAANLIIERTAGKVVERVEIKSSDPWQDILDEVLDDEVLKPVSSESAAR